MSILPIRTVPDPILRRKARQIKIVDDAIRKLARDMIETMQNAGGVGLAANQVGVLKRLIVLQMPEEDPRIMVNPEITRRQGERQVEEGCLSVPGYVGMLTRSISVKARALDESGGRLRVTAEDLLAQAIEHEIDHLNGILFLDHLRSHEDLKEATPADHAHRYMYEVDAEHGDANGHGQVERLRAEVKMARFGPDSPLSEFKFDLSDRGRP